MPDEHLSEGQQVALAVAEERAVASAVLTEGQVTRVISFGAARLRRPRTAV